MKQVLKNAALVAGLICVTQLVGCNKRPEMAQVRGKVTYMDGSIPHGGACVVRFEPAKDSTAQIRKGASGIIKPDGTFEAYTRIPGDGVYLGDYGVTFAVWSNATDPGSSIIDPKYTSAATSGYKVTVDKDLENLEFKIEPLPGAAKK